ncbi:DUF4382 domain-containing protein [Marinobacter fonticola]|uniref:DUF4382 domain-containing protein n=1 Tax=Marinobacter fonticola TaxID=2603215 RepID=UPI00143D35A1|nr:DUF4382 domain-containing protein [Marinobacter fonticola]
MKNIARSLMVVGIAISLTACEWEFGTIDDDEEGRLSLDLADAPVDDLTEVNITVVGVEIKPSDEDALVFTYEEPRTYDLLELQNGDTAELLSSEDVPAESYEWIRLNLSPQSGAHYVVGDDGGRYSLAVPSGAQSGLQVNAGFSVEAEEDIELTLDFDVRKSVVASGSTLADYLLRPVLRLVINDEVGAITGTVDESTVIAVECADVQDYAGLVYVYQGADVAPDDLGSGTEPVVAVPVTDEDDPGTYRYQASLISEGNYTVSYSCDIDDNETDEDLAFIDSESVRVEAGDQAEINFN